MFKELPELPEVNYLHHASFSVNIVCKMFTEYPEFPQSSHLSKEVSFNLFLYLFLVFSPMQSLCNCWGQEYRIDNA